MNTYKKYCPNVFIAKCDEKHGKGEVVEMATKYGDGHNAIIINYMGSKEECFYYSVVREDGFNAQEWAKKRAARLQSTSANATRKSNEYYEKSNKDREFLSLGQPILIGHHSEKRHRKIIEQAHNNMGKSIELKEASKEYDRRAEYWESKANDINLSMPESIEFFEYKLEEAKKEHAGLKNGTIEKQHSFSLTYAKKAVNELTKKVEIAKKLWGE